MSEAKEKPKRKPKISARSAAQRERREREALLRDKFVPVEPGPNYGASLLAARDERVEGIVALIRQDLPLEAAGDGVGIPAPRLKEWMATGLDDFLHERKTPYSRLYDSVSRALVVRCGEGTKALKAGKMSHEHATHRWLLERTVPQWYSAREEAREEKPAFEQLADLFAAAQETTASASLTVVRGGSPLLTDGATLAEVVPEAVDVEPLPLEVAP